MDAKALEEKIKLLEQIIDLQRQLLAEKPTATPIYYPPYDPWRPWTPYIYEHQPYSISQTDGNASVITVNGSGIN